MSKQKKAPKQRNLPARALAHALFRQRVVPSGKVYRRKGRKPSHNDGDQ